MQFQLVLQDTTQKAYRSFIGFLLFFHLVAAGIISMNAGATTLRADLYIATGFFLLLTVLFLLFSKQNKGMLSLVAIALLPAGSFFWFRFAGWLAVLLFAAVGVLAMLLQRRSTIVLVGEEGVIVKRPIGTTRYGWQQLSNLVLKDGLLTIDLQNNKMIQAEIGEATEPVDETSFNRFSAARLPNNQ